ncbi:MAG: Wzz/FepE/Etk N-terminal domain-containing protein [Pseudohongiella sp.]|nr:Wzz/FepE/Etk N-terminal domain-containing protein [Pseudohongiella sp.]
MNIDDYQGSLNRTSHQTGKGELEDEISLRELFEILWSEKIMIISVVFIAAVTSVFYALSLDDIYRADAIIAPASSQQSSSGLSNQFGGAAALFGVSLGGNSQGNTVGNALAVMTSREFITRFIERHNLIVPLFASEWDSTTKETLINSEIFDVNSQTWLAEGGAPSLQQAVRALRGMLAVSTPNRETGIISVSIQSTNPAQASKWVNLLISDINLEFKRRDLTEASNAIAYLQSQLQATQLVEMRSVLYELIESQTRITMLADARDEYVFQVIDPAVEPDEKISPRRSLICIIWTLIGVVAALMLVFVRRGIRYYRAAQKSNA